MPTKRSTAKRGQTHFEQVPLQTIPALAHEGADAPRTKNDVGAEPGVDRKRAAPVSHFHGVQFYESPDVLCRIVGRFVGEGLEQGAKAVLIVTPDHSRGIEVCLRACDIDVHRLMRAGVLVVVDARDTLNEFMVDGMPNPSAFRRTVGAILKQMRGTKNRCAIRVYGEMVDLLWKDGHDAAAIRLETLWNQLAISHEFDLLCGYSMGNFYKGAALDEIRAQHTHSVPGDDGAAAPTHIQGAAGSSESPVYSKDPGPSTEIEAADAIGNRRSA